MSGQGEEGVQPTLAPAPASAPGERHLVLVDTESGEQLGSCPSCAHLEDEVAGLTETIRSQAAKIRELRRDKERSARSSEVWPLTVEAFRYWQAVCAHPRSKFNVSRYEVLAPYIEKHGLAMVKLAIDGAAFDPHRASKPNRNGKIETYDAIETIFKSPASFERHVNRAPAEKVRAVREAGDMPPPWSELDLRVKAETIVHLRLEAGEKAELVELVDEAVHQAKLELTHGHAAEPERKPTPSVESQGR